MSAMRSPRARAALAWTALPLLAGEEEGRLLVREGDEADRERGLQGGEGPRQLEQAGHAAGVVVRAGAAAHRVVVRADQQDCV